MALALCPALRIGLCGFGMSTWERNSENLMVIQIVRIILPSMHLPLFHSLSSTGLPTTMVGLFKLILTTESCGSQTP
ncbi:hypothetical protein DL96DRAFT_1589660 [Flagelloscypha sp. PMI_526]|nr:hypothetical protein DL96DRAFT_1589660 [Flagelloscypha sp. PMI_526]